LEVDGVARRKPTMVGSKTPEVSSDAGEMLRVPPSNVLSEARRGCPEAVAWLRSADPDQVFLSVVTLGEITKGIRQRARSDAQHLIVSQSEVLLSVTHHAETHGRPLKGLRQFRRSEPVLG
jgi:hypothetical protein